MRKKGFTLVELLGVLIILSAIVLIVFPSILNQVKKSQGKINEATKLMISSATSLYLEENQNKYGYIKGDTYCISLRTLVEKGKLSAPIKDQSGKEISLDTFVKATVIQERNVQYELVKSCQEHNTTPGIPNDPDLEPGNNRNAPVIEFTGSNYLLDKATTFDVMEGVMISDDKTPKSEIKVNVIGEVSLGIAGKYPIVYEAIDEDSNVTTKVRIIEIIKTEYTFGYKEEAQEFFNPIDGKYKIELWGAAGGSYSKAGGAGAYTAGTIELKKGTYYIYIGEHRNDETATFNGGGAGGQEYNTRSGGGATDFRLINGNWDNPKSLASRIMVAAGGGGANGYEAGSAGGAAGGLVGVGGMESQWSGGSAPYTNSTGGTQTSGGIGGISNYSNKNGENGMFGKAGSSGSHTAEHGGGGGSGYYGGGSGSYSNAVAGSGAGGSSYISGHLGCVAITSETEVTSKFGCSDGTTDLTCSYHYSGYIFENTVMKAGNDSMPTHDGTSTMTGNSGNGYAKITLIIE